MSLLNLCNKSSKARIHGVYISFNLVIHRKKLVRKYVATHVGKKYKEIFKKKTRLINNATNIQQINGFECSKCSYVHVGKRVREILFIFFYKYFAVLPPIFNTNY